MVGGRVIDYFLTPMAELASVLECTKITQTRIRPHDPVAIKVDRRPHLTKVLAPKVAKKRPEGEPAYQGPTWTEARANLKPWGWTHPKFSIMNPAQELYLYEMRVMIEAVDLGNKYCEWSAAVTVQNITPHYKDEKDIKSHLGMGQPLAFSYQGRPKRTPQEYPRNKVVGLLTEAFKLIIRAKKTKVREGNVLDAQRLVDLVWDQDRIQQETT